MNTFYKSILFVLLFSLTNCTRKDDDFPKELIVKDFVWSGMNAYYKWQKEVPDLADDKFGSQLELNSFLNGFETPEDLFGHLIYKSGSVDKFSFIVENYAELEQSLDGIRTTTGLKFSVKEYVSDPEKLYAYVTNVIPNSIAEREGLKRGYMFNKVDNVQLSKSNINTIMKSSSFSVTLINGFEDGDPLDGEITYKLSANQISDNPIQINKVLDIASKNIGYLMYNQFSQKYNSNLNDVFGQFKDKGINELIVDLRYNGGGSIKTAQYLASMITGQFTNEVFCVEKWNDKIMNNIDNHNFINKFTDVISTQGSTNKINSLNLERVYFIVSDRTASASELLINGLKPYIDVKLIGSKTAGKQVGSITLYDSDNYEKTGSNFNKSHNYALHTVVVETENSNGESNVEGYEPDLEIYESSIDLGTIGDENEPLLSKTIQYILTGNKSSTMNRSKVISKYFWNNSMNQPDYQRMYSELK